MEESKTTKEMKPSYDELKNYVNQLMMQRNELVEKYREVTSAVNKLPWLFKVLKYEQFFSTETVDKAIKEISSMLFYEEPEEQEEANNKEDE